MTEARLVPTRCFDQLNARDISSSWHNFVGELRESVGELRESVGELRESVGGLRESVGELQDKVDLLF
jgi:uncharacterized protein YjbJ (UPF0337 family)